MNFFSGDKVNIEVDVLAKMVERSLAGVYENKSEYTNKLENIISGLELRIITLENKIERLYEASTSLVK